MTWTFVQSKQETIGTTSPASVVFTAPVTNGNIVVGSVFFTPQNAVDQITSITDDKSNAYSIVTYNGPNASLALFWSNGRLTNGPQTITVSTGVFTTTNLWINVNEFLPSIGTLVIDGSSSANGNSTTPSAGSFTTSNGDLIYAATVNIGGSTAGSGFSILNGNGTSFADEWQAQTSTGAINPSFTASNGTWAAGAISIANTSVVNRIIHNGPRNLVTEHVYRGITGVSPGDTEGSLLAPASKLFGPFGFTPATLTPHLKVRRIIYNISPNCEVAVLWLATTPVLLAVLQGYGYYNLADTQGIINDAAAGISGDIGFFTQFPTVATATFAPSGGYTIVLQMIKGT